METDPGQMPEDPAMPKPGPEEPSLPEPGEDEQLALHPGIPSRVSPFSEIALAPAPARRRPLHSRS